ncbi:MAG: hypothetical protein WDO24_28390 [Pseudomonadota bacterium]
MLPGLIDVHSHPEHEPAYRGIREEHGLPGMYMSGLFERSQAYAASDDAFRGASAEFAYCRAAAQRRHHAGRYLAGLGTVGPS